MAKKVTKKATMAQKKVTKKATKKSSKGGKKGWKKARLTEDVKSLKQSHTVNHFRKHRSAEIKVFRQAQKEVCAGIVGALSKVPTEAHKFDEKTAKEATILAFKGKVRVPDAVYEALPKTGEIMRDNTGYASKTPLVRSGMQQKWYDQELEKLCEKEGVDVHQCTRIFWKAFRSTKMIEREYRRKKREEQAKRKAKRGKAGKSFDGDSSDDDDEDGDSSDDDDDEDGDVDDSDDDHTDSDDGSDVDVTDKNPSPKTRATTQAEDPTAAVNDGHQKSAPEGTVAGGEGQQNSAPTGTPESQQPTATVVSPPAADKKGDHNGFFSWVTFGSSK